MNEKISDQFNKYSPEQIDKLNKMINSLVSEYKAKGVEINLEMDKEHVVYTKKNGDKAMFPKWEKMPIKNEMPMGTGDYIRETIDKDLED